MNLARDLLERAARASPATVQERGSGWWLRYTEGLTWWSGAVLAHDPLDGGRLVERIEAAERFYAGRAAVVRFQVCPGCPPDLDRVLAGRGYRWDSPVSLLTTPGTGPVADAAAPGLEVRVGSVPDPGWLAVMAKTTAGRPAVVDREARLLGRVGLPSAYVTVLADKEPVAIGRAVAEDGWTGVFGMVTVPAARRRGAARLVLSAIARWACEHGAPRLYLQVERSNEAARRLYAAAGFTEVATYHYRVRG